ncbi:MAG: phospholipid carrier-dependent glycosyltransferase [Elusimicrobia bacterium]|nr:phospholipid carrier-dependent glycosyltransferase [Elusimicrobiota bacterium]
MKKAILAGALALAAYFYMFSGINWAVPSRSRVDRLLDPKLDTAPIYEGMTGARNYVYKDTQNHIAASPFKRTDEFRVQPRVEVNYPKQGGSLFFYNYLRHYYLCGDDPDESGVWNAIGNLKPHKLQFNPHYVSYGGGYFYTLAAYLKTLSLLNAVELVPDMKYYFANPDEMGKLYTAARSWSALIGALGIALLACAVYRKTGSALWSLVTAVLLFSSPTIICVSKLMKPHLLILALTVIVMLLVDKYLSGKNNRHLLAALAVCGAAAGTVIYAGILAVYPVLAYVQAWERGRGWRTTLKELAQGFAVMAAAFILLNPYWLLEPKEVADNLLTAGHGALVSNAWGSLLVFARYTLGTVPAAVFAPLAAYSLFRWKELPPHRKVLLQFLLLLLYSMGSISPDIPANMRFVAFALPLYVFFVVDWASGIRAARKAVAAAAVLAALLSMYNARAYRVYFLNACDDATDTKMQAGAWIDSNLRGASVGHTADLIPFTFPPLRLAERELVVYQDVATLVADKNKPDYIVATGTLLYVSGPEEKEAFLRAYKPFREFANSVEVMPDSWRMLAANITVYVYKKI